MNWPQALSIILPMLSIGAVGLVTSLWARKDNAAARVADAQRVIEQRTEARLDRQREAYWGILNIAEQYVTLSEFRGTSVDEKHTLLRDIPSHLNNVRLFGKRTTHAPASAMVEALKASDLDAYRIARDDFIEAAGEDADPQST